MQGKPASITLLFLLLVSALVFTFRNQPVVADALGTITINADGSITPPTAPISTADNVTYILTGNIISDADGIVIERNNIIIDGAGYTIQGPQGKIGSHGIYSQGTNNITIRNTNFIDFASCIEFDSASYILIRGNNVTPNGLSSYGVALFNSSNSNISSNNVKNCGYRGIDLFLSSYNTVSGNNVTKSTFVGVSLTYSSYNAVSENNIAEENVGCGVELMVSSYNVVSRNKIDSIELFASALNAISNNIISDGLLLDDLSDNNTVSRNNITTAGPGVRIVKSSYNEIFHNNFIDNIPQVISDTSLNFWDNGYPSGGNFWSDYNGTDSFSGQYQNMTGSDGIGDTPYVIGVGNMDNYPLMNLWRWQDVAVTSVVAVVPHGSSNVGNGLWVFQGLPVYVNVTVLNNEDYDENVTLTLYYNSTPSNSEKGIDSLNILLSAGQTQTIVLAWNTTAIPYCLNYTLTAVATVPLDDNPTHNNLSCGPITLRIMGDINGDGKVDGRDILTVARAFASYGPNYLCAGSLPSLGWNLDSDINCDNKVDGRDLLVAARNFGK